MPPFYCTPRFSVYTRLMRNPKYSDYSIWFLVTVIILILNITPIMPLIRNAVLSTFLPIQYAFVNFRDDLNSQMAILSRAQSLSNNLATCEMDRTRLNGKLSTLSELQRENEVLKSHLANTIETPEPDQYARVIGRTSSVGTSTILVDRGASDSVTKGMIALNGNALAGIVKEVNENSSLIQLLHDGDFRVAAVDQDSPSRPKGVVRGQYSTVVVMEKVYQSEIVKVGDKIVTSGEDNTFPKGILIGTVSDVKVGSEQVLKNVLVTPELDLSRIEEVFLRKP